MPLEIVLLERHPQQLGRGVAYSATQACHRLNVPAANMSAFPDEPDHFLRWAIAQTTERETVPPGPTAFMSRQSYGDYLRAIFHDAIQSAPKHVVLEKLTAEVQSLHVTDSNEVELGLASGRALRADQVVLALGNFRPGNPTVRTPSFYDSDRYIDNPWAPDVFTRLQQSRSCLFIGSGLTMVDWANALALANHTGTLHTLSRHGLPPMPHRLPSQPASLPENLRTFSSVRQALRDFRNAAGRADDDWRCHFDALRPVTQQIWIKLPVVEKRRFMRHLRPYWDQHRHRLAPEVAQRLHDAFASGMIHRHVGKVVEFRPEKDSVEAWIEPRRNARPYCIKVDSVINCCGAESDYRKLEHPLVRSLFETRLAVVDDLGLGLKVDQGGALTDASGQASDHLFTLGPPQKGTLWETTAVPEIRVQAQKLAARLLQPRQV
jgi:uncharacterized NAD(P)/FAD-binding protein YdhS